LVLPSFGLSDVWRDPSEPFDAQQTVLHHDPASQSESNRQSLPRQTVAVIASRLAGGTGLVAVPQVEGTRHLTPPLSAHALQGRPSRAVRVCGERAAPPGLVMSSPPLILLYPLLYLVLVECLAQFGALRGRVFREEEEGRHHCLRRTKNELMIYRLDSCSHMLLDVVSIWRRPWRRAGRRIRAAAGCCPVFSAYLSITPESFTSPKLYLSAVCPIYHDFHACKIGVGCR
jgi:hypothetical protein